MRLTSLIRKKKYYVVIQFVLKQFVVIIKITFAQIAAIFNIYAALYFRKAKFLKLFYLNIHCTVKRDFFFELLIMNVAL